MANFHKETQSSFKLSAIFFLFTLLSLPLLPLLFKNAIIFDRFGIRKQLAAAYSKPR